jgi:hypothetical protein
MKAFALPREWGDSSWLHRDVYGAKGSITDKRQRRENGGGMMRHFSVLKAGILVLATMMVGLVSATATAAYLEPDYVVFYEGSEDYTAEATYHHTSGSFRYYTVPGTISGEAMDEVTAIFVITNYYTSGTFSSVNWYYWDVPGEDFVDTCDLESSYTLGGVKAYWMYNNPSIPGTPAAKWDYVDSVGVAGYEYYEGATYKGVVILTEDE